MNGPTGTLLDPLNAAHARAVERVNAWRGRCLANFAGVETQITQTLVALSATRDDIVLGQLFGQRVAALGKVVADDVTAGDVASALAAFLVHEPLRAFLAHGDAKVTIDRNGRWQVVLTAIALKRRQAHSSFVVIDEAEAKSIVNTLGSDRQRLVNCLARWREATMPHTSVGRERIALRIGGATA
jgi:hypothetical protein